MIGKIKKILIVFSIVAIIVSLFCKVNAMDNIMVPAMNFINKGSTNSPIDTQEAWNEFLPTAQILVVIASVVLVVCYMYMGIKYMFADPNGKADVKQKLIGLVIATVVIYGGAGIITVLINLYNNIFV